MENEELEGTESTPDLKFKNKLHFAHMYMNPQTQIKF